MRSIPDLLTEFRSVGLAMHDARVQSGGKAKAWNKLFDRQQALYLVLRESDEGRSGLTRLALTDACSTVRNSAAARALFWDPAAVRPVLEAAAAERGLDGLTARTVLDEFDAGRLHFDYGKAAQ